MFPGTYKEFLYHKEHAGQEGREGRDGQKDGARSPEKGARAFQASVKPEKRSAQNPALQKKKEMPAPPKQVHEQKKRADAETRKRSKELQARQQRIESLESRIAETEAAIRDIEQQMSAPGFYEDRTAAQPVIDRHQALMWTVGDLMHQWEELQSLENA